MFCEKFRENFDDVNEEETENTEFFFIFMSCRFFFVHDMVCRVYKHELWKSHAYDVILRCYSENLWGHTNSFNCKIFQRGFFAINHWKMWVISACLRILSVGMRYIKGEKKNVYTTTQQQCYVL